MKKFLVLVIAIVLVTTFAAGCTGTVTGASNELDDLVITLERTACFGTCPIYTLIVRNDGGVVYEGKDFVRIKGKVEATISTDKIEELVDEFLEIDYFSLEDSYIQHTVTDLPTVITSIILRGETKSIEHYLGDFNAPEALSQLENRIDEIVNSQQWIK